MKNRVHYLDTLRTFLILLVILIHAGFVYGPGLETIWIVVDPIKSDSIGLVGLYLDVFILACMFFVSGYFVPSSLKNKSDWAFILSKLKRIMLPWLLAVVTMIPAYKALFLYSRGMPQEAWYTYFHFFTRVGSDFTLFSNNLSQSWLWFLPVLFLFQIIYLLLSRTRLLQLNISVKTALILIFSIGLLSSMFLAIYQWTGWTNSLLLHFQNERLLIYFMFFLFGSLCQKQHVMETFLTSKNYIISNIALAISMTTYTVISLNYIFNMVTPGRNSFIVAEWFDGWLYYGSALLLMLSFLHVLLFTFKTWFNGYSTFIVHINRNSYNVYIIHLVVLGMIGILLLEYSIPVWSKYLLATLLTFVASNLLISLYNVVTQHNIVVRTTSAVLFSIALLIMVNTGTAEGTPKDLAEAPSMSIHQAAMKGNLDIIKLHIEAGTDVDTPDPTGGSSPLITAVLFGQTEVASALIVAGAEVNFINNDGSTALHIAAFFCRTEIVSELLEHGADKTIRNRSGSTALESIVIPYEHVRGIYDYFASVFGPMGLVINHEELIATRPVIAEILQ